MWVQTSRNVDITQISNGHISVLLEPTVTWLGVLVVLYVLHIMIWPRPDRKSRSRSRRFWISEICRKSHFSRSISSAILAWSSKLMVDHDKTGPSLQLFGTRFLNFSTSWWSRDFEVHEMLISPESTAFYLCSGWGWCLWLWLHVGPNTPCMLAAMTVSPLVGPFHSNRVLIAFYHTINMYRDSAMSCATKRPCCCRKPSRDARHLYRKLAPNPRAMQFIERTLKLLANIGKLIEKPLYNCTSERLMHIGPISYIRISLCYFYFRWKGICCLQIYNRLI